MRKFDINYLNEPQPVRKYPVSNAVYLKHFVFPWLVTVIVFNGGILYLLGQAEGAVKLFLIASFLFISVVCIGFIALMRKALDDPYFGEISFDDERMTFYLINKKTIVFRYDECADIVMEQSLINEEGGDEFEAGIYISKELLSEEQRKRVIDFRSIFIWERKIDYGLPEYKTKFIIIGYSPDKIRELKEHLPERLRERLIKDEERCLEEYKNFLKMKRDYWSRDGRNDLRK